MRRGVVTHPGGFKIVYFKNPCHLAKLAHQKSLVATLQVATTQHDMADTLETPAPAGALAPEHAGINPVKKAPVIAKENIDKASAKMEEMIEAKINSFEARFEVK